MCGTPLLQHLMSQVYNRSITDPSKLNRYKGWSEEVYGEFTNSMISEIVQKVPIRSTDKFIDLGSGVGQVSLQVAAEAGCVSSFGVEKQDNPAQYAEVGSHPCSALRVPRLVAWRGPGWGASSTVRANSPAVSAS